MEAVGHKKDVLNKVRKRRWVSKDLPPLLDPLAILVLPFVRHWEYLRYPPRPALLEPIDLLLDQVLLFERLLDGRRGWRHLNLPAVDTLAGPSRCVRCVHFPRGRVIQRLPLLVFHMLGQRRPVIGYGCFFGWRERGG